MPQDPRLVRVFIGGPHDTTDERQKIVDLIANIIQKKFGDKFSFVPFTYNDQHNPTLLDANNPQGSIDAKCNVGEADLVVMLFRASIGNQKPPNGSSAPSASAWELEQAIEGGKASGVLAGILPFPNPMPPQLLATASVEEHDAWRKLHEAWLYRQSRRIGLEKYLYENWQDFGLKCPDFTIVQDASLQSGHAVSDFIFEKLDNLKRRPTGDSENFHSPDFERSPFCGLYEFTYEDREAYFGREVESAEVAARCNGPKGVRLLVVHGSSGVGKSSLLQAGLMKELERDAPSGASFKHIVFEPAGESGQPFKQFAAALKNLVGGRIRPSDDDLANDFRRMFEVSDPNSADIVLRQAADRFEALVIPAVLANTWAQEFVPIVVNQMEKIFDIEEYEREIFLNFIACSKYFRRIRVLCSIRQEYLGPLTRHARVNSALDADGRSEFHLRPPLRRQLADMIIQPWMSTGHVPSQEFLYFVDDILDDATDAGDAALPLLSQTLYVLYGGLDNKREDDITRDAYDKLGRLRGVVASVADKATHDVSDKELNALFRRLTTLHDGRWLRETARWDDLVKAGVSAALIDRLAGRKARLIHIGISGNEAVVRLAHDVLFDAWDPLKRYTKVALTAESERAEVIDDARRWARDGRRERHLKLRGESYHRIAARLGADPDLFAGPDRQISELYVEQARRFELRRNLIASINSGWLGEAFVIRKEGGFVELEDRGQRFDGLRPELWAAVTGNDREDPDERNWAAQDSPGPEAESLFVKDPKLVMSSVTGGWSVGHIAALFGHLPLLRRLVAVCPDVALRKGDGGSNLVTSAAVGGDLATVRYLVEELRLPFDEESKDGSRPILWAVQRRHTNVVAYLHRMGAQLQVATRDGFGTLSEAARSGDVEAVRRALENGSGIDDRTQDGQSALMVAAGAGQTEVVRFLLSQGANFHLRTDSGDTALHRATWQEKEHPEIIDLLISAGADQNSRNNDRNTPLHFAAHLGKLDLVKAIIGHDAEIDPINLLGATPLLGAAANGYAMIMRELLLRGADLNISERAGWTALHFAADDGDLSTLHELLLNAATRAILERRTHEGWTALMLAARKGHAAIVRRLVDAGAERRAAFADSTDVLALAIKSLSVATVNELLGITATAHPNAESREAS